jgi:hypothetical protein
MGGCAYHRRAFGYRETAYSTFQSRGPFDFFLRDAPRLRRAALKLLIWRLSLGVGAEQLTAPLILHLFLACDHTSTRTHTQPHRRIFFAIDRLPCSATTAITRWTRTRLWGVR